VNSFAGPPAAAGAPPPPPLRAELLDSVAEAAAAPAAAFAGVTEMVGMAVVARGRRPAWLSPVHVGDSSGEPPIALASGLLSVDVAVGGRAKRS